MYNRIAKLIVVTLVLLQLTGCIFKEEKPVGSAGVVVNVLDKDAYDDCHIKGSINVDYDDVEQYAQKNWNKDTTQIVFYCSNYRCSASLEAAKKLVKLGFKNVSAYEGGSALALHEGIVMQGNAKEAYLKDIDNKQLKESMKDGIKLINTSELKAFLKQYRLQ